MIKHLYKIWIFAFCILSASAFANESYNKNDPYELVRQVADSLFKRIAIEQEEIKKDPEILRVVVEEELAPSINHQLAANMVLGKRYYSSTSDDQKEKFYDAFKQYLVATYAGILTLYQDQKVIFEPASPIKGKVVQVKVRVLDEGKPDINIDFRLRQKRNGEWAAYDMVAEGISVLTSKKKELQSLLRQQGVDSVTQLLLDKAAKPIVVKKIG